MMYITILTMLNAHSIVQMYNFIDYADDDVVGSCMKTPTSTSCTSTDFGATDTLPDLMVGQ